MRDFLPDSATKRTFVLLAIFACAVAAASAATTVSNVRAGQRAGTKLVDIDYDITGTRQNFITATQPDRSVE